MDGSQCTVKLPSVLLVGATVTFCTIGGGAAGVTVTVVVELAPEQVGVMQACARYWYDPADALVKALLVAAPVYTVLQPEPLFSFR